MFLTILLLILNASEFDAYKSINLWNGILFHRINPCLYRSIQPAKEEMPNQTNYYQVKDVSMLEKMLKKLDQFSEVKETSRMFRRTVFGKEDWKRHRSSNRYVHELLNMHKSFVIRGLATQAFGVFLLSAFIVAYNTFIESRRFPFPMLIFSFPPLPFSLLSPSLGLLLVFRTNAAYSRWKDARISWATVSAKSFDLIRQGLCWMTDKKLKAMLVRYTVAFSKSLKWYLGHRGNVRKLRNDLVDILTKDEIDQILQFENPAQCVLLKLTQIVSANNLLPNIQSQIDRALIELTKEMEVCDRIFTTPIPLVYTRHTARFLILWLITVPMSLYHELSPSQRWIVPIIAFLNAIFLLGIEDLGVQIEEPFSILPLAVICNKIQTAGQMALKDANIQWFHDQESENVTLNYIPLTN